MTDYRAGDIMRWVFLNIYGEVTEKSNHLLILSNNQRDGYFVCVELEDGHYSDCDWRLECGGGYWEIVA
jgi:hypothetical protein